MLALIASLFIAQDAGVQRVVARLAEVAASNAAMPEPKRVAGDELADLYIRNACGSGQPARAILLGIAYALEPTALITKNPIAADAFKDVETQEARKARLLAMGKPTLRGREDWLAHFAVSAGMVVLVGDKMAEAIGIQKEFTDAVAKAQGDGSGFSFSDLNADLAGTVFAVWVTGDDSEAKLSRCAKTFRGLDFLPDPVGLRDGLSLDEFESAWGGVNDPRMLAERRRLRALAAASKVYEAK